MENVLQMIRLVKNRERRPKISVEIEKVKPGIIDLLESGSDVVFISKDFARANQLSDMSATVEYFSKRAPR